MLGNRMNYDFNTKKIKELEQEIERMRFVAEQLVVVAFSVKELRDLWRRKFGINKEPIVIDTGDMP